MGALQIHCSISIKSVKQKPLIIAVWAGNLCVLEGYMVCSLCYDSNVVVVVVAREYWILCVWVFVGEILQDEMLNEPIDSMLKTSSRHQT